MTSHLTWFQNHELGLFVLPTNLVPASHCESIREIVRIDKANFFQSKKKSFNDVLTFVDPESGAGLTVTLRNQTDLCGRKVFILPRDDLFINMPQTTQDYIQAPFVKDRFLDPTISTD